MKEDITYKEKCSLRIIIGEKRSLKLLLEMAEYGITLINLNGKKEAIDKYNSLKEEPIFGNYIKEDIFKLEW